LIKREDDGECGNDRSTKLERNCTKLNECQKYSRGDKKEKGGGGVGGRLMAETGREEDSRQEEAVELYEAELRVRIREKSGEKRMGGGEEGR
jgi:hypothetical protein